MAIEVWQQNIQEPLEEIVQLYPNLVNVQLPSTTACAQSANVLRATQAFKKFCPEIFKIKYVLDVQRNNKPTCVWTVDYSLKDNENLPSYGPNLISLSNCLTRFCPYDTAIIDTQYLPPTFIRIYYEVLCSCNPLEQQDVQGWLIDGVNHLSML